MKKKIKGSNTGPDQLAFWSRQLGLAPAFPLTWLPQRKSTLSYHGGDKQARNGLPTPSHDCITPKKMKKSVFAWKNGSAGSGIVNTTSDLGWSAVHHAPSANLWPHLQTGMKNSTSL